MMDMHSEITNNHEGGQAEVSANNEEAQWKEDLARLEYEIGTLRSVLLTKQREATELKRKLGITAVGEIRQDLQYGIQTVKDSNAYQKTSSALKSLGSYASQTFGSLRNSNVYKSVEVKYADVKNRLKTSQSSQDIGKEMDDHSPSSPQTPPTSPQQQNLF